MVNCEKLIPTLACLFPILTLSYGKGYKLIPIFLLLAAIWVLCSRSRLKLGLNSKWLIIAFCGYFLSFAITVFFHGESIARLDGPSRFLLCIPILIAILRYPPSFLWLSKSLVISGYVAGLSAFALVFGYGQDRAFRSGSDFFSKGFMPIQSGDIAMTFGIICFPIAIYYLQKSARLAAVICSVGAAFGITASYLSGSRGGWVFVPLAIVFLLYSHRSAIRESKNKLVNFIILVLPTLLIFCAVNLTPQLEQKTSRIKALTSEIGKYSQGEAYSSTGIRIELWRDSIYTFMDYPLLGAGYEMRRVLKTERVKDGIIKLPKKYLSQHSHSQYFESLSVQGVMGFSALMGIFLIPLYICRRIHKKGSLEVKTIASCTALSIIMMMGYCLTQAIFRHNSGAIFYPLLTVILLGFCLANTKAHDLEK